MNINSGSISQLTRYSILVPSKLVWYKNIITNKTAPAFMHFHASNQLNPCFSPSKILKNYKQHIKFLVVLTKTFTLFTHTWKRPMFWLFQLTTIKFPLWLWIGLVSYPQITRSFLFKQSSNITSQEIARNKSTWLQVSLRCQCHPLIFLQHTSAILLSNFQGQRSSSNENYVGLLVMECIKSIQMDHASMQLNGVGSFASNHCSGLSLSNK